MHLATAYILERFSVDIVLLSTEPSKTLRFRPQFKVHLMCNDTPVIDGSDSGVKRRVRKIDYISRFVESFAVSESELMFLRDPELISAFKTQTSLKLAFLLLCVRV
jgi:hypothetical protein